LEQRSPFDVRERHVVSYAFDIQPIKRGGLHDSSRMPESYLNRVKA
jgi:hypothetical protein